MLANMAYTAKIVASKKVALSPLLYEATMPSSSSGLKSPRSPLAPAVMTLPGSAVGALVCKASSMTLLKIDSPVETKMAAPTSWKTKANVSTALAVGGEKDTIGRAYSTELPWSSRHRVVTLELVRP